jgi:hypothetical protein
MDQRLQQYCARRFGKSLNLSTLKSFLSHGAKPSDFERYFIGKDQKFVEDHCGKYPVVFLNLKDYKGRTWEEMYKKVWTREVISFIWYQTENDHKF